MLLPVLDSQTRASYQTSPEVKQNYQHTMPLNAQGQAGDAEIGMLKKPHELLFAPRAPEKTICVSAEIFLHPQV